MNPEMNQSAVPSQGSTLLDEHVIQQAGAALCTLSHFAKNMLQMVGGAAEVADLCIERKDYDRLQKGWAVFMPNLERLKRLTMDLCEYSKNRPLSLEACNVNSIVQDSVRTLPDTVLTAAPNIHLRAHEQVEAVRLDPLKIKQMVQHLLIHIADILPAPDTSIQIDIRSLPGQDEVMIGVWAPLNNKDLNEVRDWFNPQEYKNCRLRTGLDLPLALRLAEYHHGRIEAEIRPDGDTAFLVFLPANLS